MFKKILLVAFGITSAAIALEIGVRLLLVLSKPPTLWNDRPERYYIEAKSPDRPVPTEVEARAANTYRIIVIGDSFTYGPNMQRDDTFPERLERFLNLSNATLKAEVINWGVPGFSTAQEYRMLRENIERATPNLVILEITLNDPELQPYRVTHPNLDEHGKPKLDSPIYEWCSACKFIMQRILNSQTRKDYVTYYFDLFENQSTWSNFTNALSDLHSLTEKTHTPIVAVVFPLFSHPLDENYPFQKLHDKVNQALGTTGISSLDLRESFKDIPPERLQVIPGQDSHPNEIAHRIAAEKIFNYLSQNNLVPAELTKPRTLRKRL